MARYRIGLATLPLLALLPRGAGADLPPPQGYVEACQVAKVQKKGEFCTTCTASYGDPDGCARRFHADKRTWDYRCHARGASVWQEIWCTSWSGPAPPRIPAPAPAPGPKR